MTTATVKMAQMNQVKSQLMGEEVSVHLCQQNVICAMVIIIILWENNV